MYKNSHKKQLVVGMKEVGLVKYFLLAWFRVFALVSRNSVRILGVCNVLITGAAEDGLVLGT